ncbi:MFS transporter [Amycolatopsis suaedae]|uniref:MFS transporter n=1 Tax=Amycolatopsis suaedae TaxID=2510978 RepID=UPI0013EF2271|nr:MFS transporter [Amycolatopsis suaedae]
MKLWHHGDFRRLWAGDTVTQFGTFVSLTVLPLVAATALAVTPFEMGLLSAAEHAAFLLFGLPAGVWIDRMRRKPLMISANVVRGVALLTVPVAWWTGVLSLPHLLVVALAVGVCTLFFDVAYQSYLPSLVGREHLVEGNAKLQASQSVAQVAGPGVGGGLAQLAGAANAVALTGLSYLASAVLLRRIRAVEPPPERDPGRRLTTEVAEGLRFVFGNPNLRAIVGCTGTANLASGAFVAMEILFLTRDLRLSAGAVGVVLAIGGAGGVLGALTAGWWARRVGQARTILISALTSMPVLLLVPLAEPGWGAVLVAGALAVYGYGVIVYNVAQVSYRQAICPDRLLGRMNASIRFVVWGLLPVGQLAGGVLGEWLGVRGAIWAAAVVSALCGLWVLFSPLRRLRNLPSEVAA